MFIQGRASGYCAPMRAGPSFFAQPAGQRVLRSALDDLALEGLSKESFAAQKRNRWRLQGKSLYDLFGEVASPDEYPFRLRHLIGGHARFVE